MSELASGLGAMILEEEEVIWSFNLATPFYQYILNASV
jgi:hypothetical protein